MPVVTIGEAQARLSELIHVLGQHEELVITENNQPVARLLPIAADPAPAGRQLGTLKGTITYIAPDFDAPLEEFRECME